MSIKVIKLRFFSELAKADIYSTTQSHQRHAVFYSFLSDDSKHDPYTTTAHSKNLVSLLKEKKVMTKSLSKIW